MSDRVHQGLLLSGTVRCAVLAVLAAGTLVACGGAQGRYAEHMARGQRYLAAGELGKANVEFRNALQIQPKAGAALYFDGRVCELRGDIRNAVALYRAAIDATPEEPRGRAALARVLVVGQEAQRALEVIAPGLAKHPDDVGLLAARAGALLELKDTAAARADADRAVQLAPTNEDAVTVSAAAYVRGGDLPRAIAAVTAAVARTPSSVALQQLLVELYVDAGQADKAEQQLRQVITLTPAQMEPRLRLAKLLADAHRLDDAQTVLEEAVKALPRSSAAKLTLIDFLARERSPEAGERALRAFIARDPDEIQLRLGLGELLQRSDKTDEAIACYQEIIARKGREADALVARDRIASLELSRGNYARAQGLVAEVLEQNPRDNDALTLRANLALARGDPAAAIADLRAVLRDQPASLAVLRALAQAHLANNEPELAEESLRNAVSVASGEAGPRIDLAELLLRTGRTNDAISLLLETIRSLPLRPGTPARVALVHADLAQGDLSAARAAAEELKKLRPEIAAGPYLAGLVAQQQKRLDEAQREFEHALQVEPRATDALSALAHLELERGHADEAIELVRAALERSPRDAVTQNLLGEVYLTQKRYSEAIAAFGATVRLTPRWWLAYRNLATAKAEANDPAGAQGAYEAGVKATGEPVLLMDLAAFDERAGHYDEAIHEYETLHERSPRLEVAANNLAMLLVSYRADRPSLERARTLTAPFANSEIPALLDTHGWVMLKCGDLAEALSALQKAADRAPGSRVIHYHLGMAQLQAGQNEKARQSLEAALSGRATFHGTEEARLALARLNGRSG
jgi:tetratricopeptide (TPR) repeat protein